MRKAGSAILRVTVPLAVAVAMGACDGSPPRLPPLQATSQHFRYHASTAENVPAGVLDGLEANRSEILSYLGLENDEVVDYYRFDSLAELDATGLCGGDGSYCTIGRQVMTEFPLHHHELIHAYLADLGSPPHAIEEGVADAIGCVPPSEGPGGPVVPAWQDLFRVYRDRSEDFYRSSMQLVRYLVLQFGPVRFIDYYRQARFTADAAVFAQDFQAYWSITIDDAWAAADISSGPVPTICPCRAQPLLPGPNPQRFIHDYDSDYRLVGVPLGSALTVAALTPTDSYIRMGDCSQAQVGNTLFEDQVGVSLVQLDSEPRYLSFSGAPEDDLVVTSGAPIDLDCARARSLGVDPTMVDLSILVPKGSAPWYVRLSVAEPTTLARLIQNRVGLLRICSDCSLSDCRSVSAWPTAVDISDGEVLVIDPSGLQGAGLATFPLLVGGQ